MHLLLGLAHKMTTQLQKLNTAFHLGCPDIAEIPQSSLSTLEKSFPVVTGLCNF